MGVHRLSGRIGGVVALTTARRLRRPQFPFRARGLSDIARLLRVWARAVTLTVIPVTLLLPLLIGAAEANSLDEGGRGAHFTATAKLEGWSSTRGREQTGEIISRPILAQRMDKARPAEPLPVRRPATAGSTGSDRQRAPADTPAHETTSSLPADSGAVQAASEAERINQKLQMDQERERRNKLTRELAAIRAELEAARQIQAHTVSAIAIGIQQTQALEQEREKTSNLSRELSFLRTELDVARVAASKAMQAPEGELKQERPVDRRNGAKRFALQLASLRSELDTARSAASEAAKSAAAEAEQRQALERELKQEQDKTETLINELGTLRAAASEAAKGNAADAGQKQALTRELENQRARAENAVSQLNSLRAELTAAQTASSELAAHRTAEIEHNRALEREAEQQRSRADALTREAASLTSERDAARAEASRAAEAAAKAKTKREKEQEGSSEAPPPTFGSVRVRLAAWNAFAAVVAPSRDGRGRAPSQGTVHATTSPPPEVPASTATPPNAQLTTGTAAADAKATAAAERSVLVSAAPRPLANEERLLAHASALLQHADINAARRLLEYILGYGSAQAAFMLAETYDPHVLQSWDARGVAGDSAKARELYERARAGGIHDADGRIKGLK